MIPVTSRARAAEKVQHRLVIASQCADAIDALLGAVLPCRHQGGGEHPKCTRCARRQALRDAAAEVRKTGGLQP